MGRTRKSNREPLRPKPVEKVELSEKHVKLRFVLVILLAAIGAAAIAIGVSSLFHPDAGWREIEAKTQGINCGADFDFLYELGVDGASPSEESRAVSQIYSSAAEKAYQLFTDDESFEGVCNIRYINQHPNEKIQVDQALYQAFSQLKDAGNRSVFLAPIYGRYESMFFSEDDFQAAMYDPFQDEETAAECAVIAAYAGDREAVDLELLGENNIRLKVSKEYLSYAKENGIESFIDFFWMKNAFIADYLAEALISAGYTHGCLSSFDGFIRNLDAREIPYSLQIYDRVGGNVYPAGTLNYAGPAGIVYLRNYGISERDAQRFYEFGDGQIRTPYADVADGLCKSACGDLACYARDRGCAAVLLDMIPVYLADSLDPGKLDSLEGSGVFSIYCENNVIHYNDPQASFKDLYRGEDISYTVSPLITSR